MTCIAFAGSKGGRRVFNVFVGQNEDAILSDKLLEGHQTRYDYHREVEVGQLKTDNFEYLPMAIREVESGKSKCLFVGNILM